MGGVQEKCKSMDAKQFLPNLRPLAHFFQQRLHPHSAPRYIRSTLLTTGLVLGQILCANNASAGPEGGIAIQGEGSVIHTTPRHTDIHQVSQDLLMNFDSFDLAHDESVLISQPNASAWFVGQINGGSATHILGSITANGRVALINPRGIVFGESARINAAGVFASGLALDQETFLDNGELHFQAQAGAGGHVANAGLISASLGGSVSLLGETVTNSGAIVATLGQVILASGSRAVVNFGSEQLIGIEVTDAVLENNEGLRAAISNSGRIQADGGVVMLTADVSKNLFDHAINNKGLIRARTAEYKGGVIRLSGSGGSVLNTGVLNVSAASANAGRILIQSDKGITLSDDALLLADGVAGRGGQIHIQADEITIKDKSLLSVNGDLGGGNIDLVADRFVSVSASSRLQADAVESGHGGQVMITALDIDVAGAVSVTGGVLEGDGGRLHLAAADTLSFSGQLDAGASGGKVGSLVLSGPNIEIKDDSGVRAQSLNQSHSNIVLEASESIIFDHREQAIDLGINSLTVNVSGAADSGAESDLILFRISETAASIITQASVTISVADASSYGNAMIDIGGYIEIAGPSPASSELPHPHMPLPNAPLGPDSTISLSAQNGRIRLRSSARLQVSGLQIQGLDAARGAISIEATDESGVSIQAGDLIIEGEIDVSSQTGRGGELSLLGKRVRLMSGARVNADGLLSGGVIFVGGNYQGEGDRQNSLETMIDQNVLLSANSLSEGDGGKIVIWSDGLTEFYGQIEATGGSVFGNGGFVEVSGKQTLIYDGVVDLSANHGELGTLLLDPKDIVIQGGAGGANDNGFPSNVRFNFRNRDSTITITEAKLESIEANIILRARDSITVAGIFGQDSNGEGTGGILRLRDGVSLTLETRNALGDGAVGIDLTAVNVEIQTQGSGGINFSTGQTGAGAGRHPGTADIRVGLLTTLGAGVVSLVAEGDVYVQDALTSGGEILLATVAGNIYLNANLTTTDSRVILSGDTILNGDSRINLSSGPGGIYVLGDVTGTPGGTSESLVFNSGSDGQIIVFGDVSGLNELNVRNSDGADFYGDIDVTTFSVSDSAADSSIQIFGNLNVSNIFTSSRGYDFSLLGASNHIEGALVLLNKGVLTLGNGDDVFVVSGGISASSQSEIYLSGTLTSGGIMGITLGDENTDLLVVGDSTIGGLGNITLGDVMLAGNVTLSLGTGLNSAIEMGSVIGGSDSSAIAIDTSASVVISDSVNIADFTVVQSGGIRLLSDLSADQFNVLDSSGRLVFEGDVALGELLTSAGVYQLVFQEDLSVVEAVNLAAISRLVLGDGADDVHFFSRGINTSRVTGKTILSGLLQTDGAVVELGAVFLGSASTVNTIGSGTSSGGADITFGSIVGNNRQLEVNSGDLGETRFTGVLSNLDTLTLENSAGTIFEQAVSAININLVDSQNIILFENNLTTDKLDLGGDSIFNLSLLGDMNVIADPVVLNAGVGITLGNEASDQFHFLGGLDSQGARVVRLLGQLSASGGIINLGNLILGAGASSISTTLSDVAGASIHINEIQGAQSVLTVSAGNGGYEVQITGDIILDSLISREGTYQLVMLGQNNAISGMLDLRHSGSLALGDDADDQFEFMGGLNLAADLVLNGSLDTLGGNVSLQNLSVASAGRILTGGGDLLVNGAITIADSGLGVDSELKTETLSILAGTGDVIILQSLDLGSVDITASHITLERGSNLDGSLSLMASSNVILPAEEVYARDGVTIIGDLQLGASIRTLASSVSISGTVQILESADASIFSENGSIEVRGQVSGSAGLSNETFRLAAGQGSITLAEVSGLDGLASPSGLTNLYIESAGTINLGPLNLTGAFIQASADVNFSGSVVLGSAQVQGANIYLVEFSTSGSAVLSANGNLSQAVGTQLDVMGDLSLMASSSILDLNLKVGETASITHSGDTFIRHEGRLALESTIDGLLQITNNAGAVHLSGRVGADLMVIAESEIITSTGLDVLGASSFSGRFLDLQSFSGLGNITLNIEEAAIVSSDLNLVVGGAAGSLDLSSSGAIEIAEVDGTHLAGLVGASLMLSSGGGITSAEGAVINIMGPTGLSAVGDINLQDLGNSFGMLNLTAPNIHLSASGGIDIGKVNVSESLTLFASTGDIVDRAGSDINVAGDVILLASNGNISLGDSENDQVQLGTIHFSANDISLVERDGIEVGSINGANLNLTATQKITQTAGGSIRITGLTKLEAESDILLANEDNQFGQFSLKGDAVSLTNANETQLDLVSVISLNLRSGGDVTHTRGAEISISQLVVDAGDARVHFDSSLGDINLDRIDVVAGEINITQDGSLSIGRLRASDAVSLISTVGDVRTIDGASVILSDQGLSLRAAGEVNFNVDNDTGVVSIIGGSLIYSESGRIELSNLQAETAVIIVNEDVVDGGIESVVGGVIAVTLDATFDSKDQLLHLEGNFGQLNILAGSVDITETSSTLLGDINVSGDFALRSQSGLSSISSIRIGGRADINVSGDLATVDLSGDINSISVRAGEINLDLSNSVIVQDLLGSQLSLNATGAIIFAQGLGETGISGGALIQSDNIVFGAGRDNRFGQLALQNQSSTGRIELGSSIVVASIEGGGQLQIRSSDLILGSRNTDVTLKTDGDNVILTGLAGDSEASGMLSLLGNVLIETGGGDLSVFSNGIDVGEIKAVSSDDNTRLTLAAGPGDIQLGNLTAESQINSLIVESSGHLLLGDVFVAGNTVRLQSSEGILATGTIQDSVGSVTLSSAGDISLMATVSSAGVISLESSANIIAQGLVAGAGLNVVADDLVDLQGEVHVVSGDFVVGAGGGLIIGTNIDVDGQVSLTSINGEIESGGTITSAVGGIDVSAAGDINLGAIDVSSGVLVLSRLGNLSFNDSVGAGAEITAIALDGRVEQQKNTSISGASILILAETGIDVASLNAKDNVVLSISHAATDQGEAPRFQRVNDQIDFGDNDVKPDISAGGTISFIAPLANVGSSDPAQNFVQRAVGGIFYGLGQGQFYSDDVAGSALLTEAPTSLSASLENLSLASELAKSPGGSAGIDFSRQINLLSEMGPSTIRRGYSSAVLASRAAAASQRERQDAEEDGEFKNEPQAGETKSYDLSPMGILLPEDQRLAMDIEGNIYYRLTLRARLDGGDTLSQFNLAFDAYPISDGRSWLEFSSVSPYFGMVP